MVLAEAAPCDTPGRDSGYSGCCFFYMLVHENNEGIFKLAGPFHGCLQMPACYDLLKDQGHASGGKVPCGMAVGDGGNVAGRVKDPVRRFNQSHRGDAHDTAAALAVVDGALPGSHEAAFKG